MIPERISLVTLGCSDFNQQRTFYNQLGWRETDLGYSDYAVFQTAGVMLSLYPIEKLAQGTGLQVAPSETTFKGVTFAINEDHPEQVDTAISQVKEVGGHVLSEPKGEGSGFRSATFADPENNIWEVAYNPGSTFDERGGMLTL